MTSFLFRLRRFFSFYSAAVTKYQLHSPFVYELAEIVLDDKRWYYAFQDIEMLRRKMLSSDVVLNVRDFGTGKDRKTAVRKMVRRAASSPCQGQRLFRLANWASPKTMLELGASVGIGSLYLISGAGAATLISLEGCPETAQVARANLEILRLQGKASVQTGPFEQTLMPALTQLRSIDLVFFDGNHQKGPTLAYFEKCLGFAHEKTVFVLDDVHWSAEMEAAWAKIQQHPRVTLTVDFFDLSLAFVNPGFKQKQHYNIVPSRWKLWKFY